MSCTNSSVPVQAVLEKALRGAERRLPSIVVVTNDIGAPQKVLVDGKELRGVRAVSVEFSNFCIASVTVVLIGDLEVIKEDSTASA